MKMKTISEIHTEGMAALLNALGPDDTIQFLRIYETRSGDWTKDREKVLEDDPDNIIKSIMARRKKVPP